MGMDERRLQAGLLVAIGAVALACGGGGGGGGGGGASPQQTCQTPGGQLTLGQYLVENNTYNNTEAALPAHTISGFTQCATLGTGSTAGTVAATWAWDWPITTGDELTVRATPTIVYGFKPWNPSSTTSSLPRRVSEVGSLKVDAGKVGVLDGSNLLVSYDVISYLTSSNVKQDGQDALDIVGSVTIFWNQQGVSFGGIPVATQISIGGVDWDLYATGSTLLYFPHGGFASTPTSLHLDMAGFLADGVHRGLIQPAWWLASIETAAIVLQGTGGFSLDGYQVTFQAH